VEDVNDEPKFECFIEETANRVIFIKGIFAFPEPNHEGVVDHVHKAVIKNK